LKREKNLKHKEGRDIQNQGKKNWRRGPTTKKKAKGQMKKKITENRALVGGERGQRKNKGGPNPCEGRNLEKRPTVTHEKEAIKRGTQFQTEFHKLSVAERGGLRKRKGKNAQSQPHVPAPQSQTRNARIKNSSHKENYLT